MIFFYVFARISAVLPHGSNTRWDCKVNSFVVSVSIGPFGHVFARAKRERVVQPEVKKVNRRPDTTRHDPTPQILSVEMFTTAFFRLRLLKWTEIE